MTHERYAFYFKFDNRDEPILYSFHLDITIKEFIEFIQDEMSYFSKKNIEIYEINNNIIQTNKMNYNNSFTLHQIFNNKINQTSFYIKFIDDT
jgi:hypothetical protein